MKLFFIFFLALAISDSNWACNEDGTSGFLPKNDLYIPVGVKFAGGLTKEQFDSVIDKLEAVYSPIVSDMGAKLIIERQWEDGTVDAKALRTSGWNVIMFGGLARHSAMTEDGFALVVCHELGHHIGGAPKKVGLFSGLWTTNEGQADYFATLKCLRRAWETDNNEEIVSKLDVPPTLAKACSVQHVWNQDYFMCVRGGMAGLSVAKLFQALRGSSVEPKFDTPDPKVVIKTDDNHPATQCRLDTYLQGALCEKSFHEDVTSASEVTGTCHGSTGHTKGLRPLCWFKPAGQ